MTSTPAPAADTPVRWWQRAAQLTVVGGLVLGLAWACSSAGADAEADPSGQVQVACKDWVKDRLKSPSTAGFSGVSTTGSGGRYTVTGQVDSQNGFGAMLRTSWTCVATHAGETSTLVSVDFG